MTLEEYQRQGIQMTEEEFKRFVNGIPCGHSQHVIAIEPQCPVRCLSCGKMVRNKLFFGTLHVCV